MKHKAKATSRRAVIAEALDDGLAISRFDSPSSHTELSPADEPRGTINMDHILKFCIWALYAAVYLAGAALSVEAAPPQPILAGVCPQKASRLSRELPMDPVLVDDNSPPEQWAPWTHRPFCAVVPPPAAEGEAREDYWDVDDPEENQDVVDELKDGVKYCTYTASYFGDYGISIVARPVTGPYIAVLLKEVYDSSFPSPETVQNMNLEPAFEIVDMPEKGGKGVIATRLIKARETFVVDYATLAADFDLWGDFGKRAGAKLLHQAAERLLDPNEAAMSLSTSGAPGHVFPAAAVMWSNTFRSEIEGVPFTGLFPRISVSCPTSSKLDCASRRALLGDTVSTR